MKTDPPSKRTPRPFIGVHFKCCNVYARVYLNRLGTAYFGHCPRCTRALKIQVKEGGSSAKFWNAE